MPISQDEDNALEKVARNTYEDPWLADGIADLNRQVATLREMLMEAKKALEGWQEWWALPWEAKRPDIAGMRYTSAQKAIMQIEDALAETEKKDEH